MTRVERRARRRALMRGVRIAARRRRQGRLFRELIPWEVIDAFVDSYSYPEALWFARELRHRTRLSVSSLQV